VWARRQVFYVSHFLRWRMFIKLRKPPLSRPIEGPAQGACAHAIEGPLSAHFASLCQPS
jgi:hypothetical protein